MPAVGRRLLFALLTLLFPGLHAVHAQTTAADTLDQVDSQGRKQGWWRVVAPNTDRTGYPDGALVEEGRYQNGRRVGVWRRYWPNGQPMSEITYQMGRPRGPYVTYYRNGQVEERGTWDLDRNTGAFQRYHPNGQLAQDFVFDEHGIRNGEQRYYHPNGQLAVQVTVRDGREEGPLKRYNEKGQLTQEAEFKGGVINEANSRWIKPVPKASELKPDASAPPAPTVSADEKPNAVPFRETGWNTLYDRQLRISQQGHFVDGRLSDGKVYLYNADGLLTRIKVYKGGRYAGDAPITDEDRQ